MENSHNYIVTQILFTMYHWTKSRIQYEVIIWFDSIISPIWHGKRQDYLYFNYSSQAHILVLWWKYRCTSDLRWLGLYTDICKSAIGRENLEKPCIVSCNDIDFQRFDFFSPCRTGQLSIHHILFVSISKYSDYSILLVKWELDVYQETSSCLVLSQ